MKRSAGLACCGLLLLLVALTLGCVVEVKDNDTVPAPDETKVAPEPEKKPIDNTPKRAWEPRKTAPPELPVEPEPEPAAEPTPDVETPPTPEPEPEPAAGPAPPETPVQGKPIAKEYRITLAAYSYSPKNITVVKGDLVRLILTSNSDGLGEGIGYKVDGLPIDAIVKKGQTQTVEFVAERAGNYVVSCGNPCGPGRAGLKLGEIIVAGGI